MSFRLRPQSVIRQFFHERLSNSFENLPAKSVKFSCRDDKSMAYMFLSSALIGKTDADSGKNWKPFYRNGELWPNFDLFNNAYLTISLLPILNIEFIPNTIATKLGGHGNRSIKRVLF